MIFVFLKLLLIIIPLLISVAYFTLVERKVLGAIQRRKGPNVIGIFGLFQPLSDGFKLLIKESIMPSSASSILFIVSPILTFIISLLGWAVIPFSKYSILVQTNIGILYLLGISSLGIYGIIFSGWSSNSKYSFLGALRSTAQMISYEVSIGFIILTIVVCSGSLDLQKIIFAQNENYYIVSFFPLFLIFFISSLAETNRHPFDLPEAEAELVAGYNTEYSAMSFALFSLSEYANMLLMCFLNVILFFGGYSLANLSILSHFILGSKIICFVILFIVLRAALPRYRYDQLMTIGWKIFVPISLAYLIFTSSIFISFNWLTY